MHHFKKLVPFGNELTYDIIKNLWNPLLTINGFTEEPKAPPANEVIDLLIMCKQGRWSWVRRVRICAPNIWATSK